MQNKRVIIFDFDGTLMDSLDYIADCVQKAFDAHQVPRPAKEAIKRLAGYSSAKVVQTLCPELDESHTQAVLATYREIYLTWQGDSSTLYEGIRELLQALHGKGKVLAIATGRGRVSLETYLEQFELAHLFSMTITPGEAASKPSPEMLEKLQAALEFTTEEAVVVGDSTYDIEMAHAAGMESIALDYGAHSKQALAAAAPSLLLSSVKELKEALLN